MTDIQKVISGLQILQQYSDMIHGEHDILYAGPEDSDEIDEQDAKQLKKFGWHVDQCGCWSIFT